MLRTAKPIFYGCLIASAAAATNTHASEADIDLAFFASFAYANTLSDDSEGNLNSIDTDSTVRDFNRLGIRMDADLSDKLTFTAQMLAKGKTDYDPEIDWLFATYSFTPNFTLSVGKIRMPLYMYSDIMDVGYAYQWIRPPESIYAENSLRSLDGAKISWAFELGEEWTSEMQLWGGRTSEYQALVKADMEMDDALGLTLALERDWLSLRAVFLSSKTTINIDDILDDVTTALFPAAEGVTQGLPLPVLSLASVRELLDYKDEKTSYASFGVFMDFEHVFFGSEYAHTDVDTNIIIPNSDAYYVMAGTRLPGNWSLSLTYDKKKHDLDDEAQELYNELTSPYSIIPGVSDALGGIGMAFDTILQDIQFSNIETYTLGARWDFHKSAAFKMEYITQVNETFTQELKPKAYRLALDLAF